MQIFSSSHSFVFSSSSKSHCFPHVFDFYTYKLNFQLTKECFHFYDWGMDNRLRIHAEREQTSSDWINYYFFQFSCNKKYWQQQQWKWTFCDIYIFLYTFSIDGRKLKWKSIYTPIDWTGYCHGKVTNTEPSQAKSNKTIHTLMHCKC